MSAVPAPATVLHVIATMNLGGAERQLALLLRSLDRRRFRPLLACTTRGGPLLTDVEASGVPVKVFGKLARLDPTLIVRLAAFIRRERPDLVHTWMFTSNTWGRMAAVLARAPAIIASERCVDLWKNPVHVGLDRLLARPSKRILANSEAVARFLVEREGLPAAKVRVIRNGLDPGDAERLRPRPPAEIERLRRDLGIPAGARVVGDVSRLDAKNGLLCWVHVIERLAARHPGLVALLVGGTSLRAERLYARRLEEAIRRHGLGDRVRLLGVRRDLENVLPALEVFLHTSTMEGFPNSIMEAMAAGIPVVATRAGGTPELVLDGQTGYLLPIGQVPGLAERAATLLADAPLRSRMGQAAARRVRELCGFERMVREVEALYGEVLEESRGWS